MKRTIRVYTEIADAIRLHGTEVSNDIEELWRRMAFSILNWQFTTARADLFLLFEICSLFLRILFIQICLHAHGIEPRNVGFRQTELSSAKAD